MIHCVRVWIATGHTDMRGGMKLQEAFRRDPQGETSTYSGARVAS
jgi:hypothetical protein